MKKFLSNNEHEIYILLIILSTFLPSIYCAFFIVYITPIIIFRIFIYKYSFQFIKIYIAFILITFLLFISKFPPSFLLLLIILLLVSGPLSEIIPLLFTTYISYVIVKKLHIKITYKIILCILFSFLLSANLKLFILIEDLTKVEKEIEIYKKIQLTDEDIVKVEYDNPTIDYGYSLLSSPAISMKFPSPIPTAIYSPRNNEENIENVLSKNMINFTKDNSSNIILKVVHYRKGNFLNYKYTLLKNNIIVSEYSNRILKYTYLYDYWSSLINKTERYNSPRLNNYIVHLSYLFDNTIWKRIYSLFKDNTYRIYTLDDFIKKSLVINRNDKNFDPSQYKEIILNIINKVEAKNDLTFSKEKSRYSLDSCKNIYRHTSYFSYKINDIYKSMKINENSNVFCFNEIKLLFFYNSQYNKLFITIINPKEYRTEYYKVNLKDFNDYNIWRTIYVSELSNDKIDLEFISHNSFKNKDIKNIIEIKLKN